MKSLLRKIYLYRAVQDLVLLYPLYAVMFSDRGMSPFQISSLFIIWSVTAIVCEVPSGVLADKYSRKNLLAIAQLIRAVGYGFWLFMPTYEGFAIGFVLWGLGGAFMSGTFEALVYDELKAVGEEKSYVKVVGRAESLAMIAILVGSASAAGGILIGYDFVTIASIVAVTAAGLIALTLPETKRVEETSERQYFKVLRLGVRHAIRTPVILKIILIGSFIVAINGTLEEYVPLFVRETGAVNWLVALVDAATVAAAALASFLAYRFENFRNSTFMILMAAAGVLLVAAGSLNGWSAWSLLVVYSFGIGVVSTVFGGRLQHAIEEGSMRATVTSVYGVTQELVVVMMFLGYGLVATYGGNAGAFKMAGALVIVAALVYLLVAPRLARRRDAGTEV